MSTGSLDHGVTDCNHHRKSRLMKGGGGTGVRYVSYGSRSGLGTGHVAFYFIFPLWYRRPLTHVSFFGLVHDFGTAWFQAADGNPPILGFGFGHTGFDFPSQKIGFSLLMVKVRRFDVGCTNGVLRFAYHLMRMVLTIAQGGRY